MPENPYQPPKLSDLPVARQPVQALLPWPALGLWLIAFFLPTMMMLATAIDLVTGFRSLDGRGTGGLLYLVPLLSLGLCWLVALTAKASLATKIGWIVFTPVAIVTESLLLLVTFGILFLSLDRFNGIQ
jgi:hypothetical protein